MVRLKTDADKRSEPLGVHESFYFAPYGTLFTQGSKVSKLMVHIWDVIPHQSEEKRTLECFVKPLFSFLYPVSSCHDLDFYPCSWRSLRSC